MLEIIVILDKENSDSNAFWKFSATIWIKKELSPLHHHLPLPPLPELLPLTTLVMPPLPRKVQETLNS